MTFLRLLLRNLLFHRRGNFAVFLGVALGTAVLTGALLVGDSLKGSLTDLALDQLGWVENAVTANRFFRDSLALNSGVPRACAVLMLRGSAGTKTVDGSTRVNKVTVLGVDERFWPREIVHSSRHMFFWTVDEPQTDALPFDENYWNGNAAEVVLNQTLAKDLKVAKGDTIFLQLPKADSVPREYLLGKRGSEDVVESIEVKVALILPDRGMARFTLTPSPEPVRNAFVPRRFLQERLNLKDKANAMFAASIASAPPLADRLTLEDWGVVVHGYFDRARTLANFLDPNNQDRRGSEYLSKAKWNGRVPDALAKLAVKNKDDELLLTRQALEQYYRHNITIESRQMLLEDAIVEAVQRVCAPQQAAGHTFLVAKDQWWLCPMLIYLADSISDGTHEAAYSVVAARGPLPDDAEVPTADQIDLARWKGSPLDVKPGDPITLSYYAPDDHNHLHLETAKFTLGKFFDLTGRYDDPELVPVYPGITDKLDLGDLNQKDLPFPYDRKRAIANNSTAYWKRYRATPKAYINLVTAQKLWGSRFGKLTSFQIVPVGKVNQRQFDSAMMIIQANLVKELGRHPEVGGFVWQDMRKQAEKAGSGSTDFGVYFLAFSFFLIVAALLLVGLLFRLNLDLRGREIGILLATGWTFPQVRRLLLGEGLVLAVFGALAGLAGSLVYADQLLRYLSRNWPGEQLLFLELHPTSKSLWIGWSASVVVSFLTILWAVRVLSRLTPVRLLAGDTTASAGVPPSSLSSLGSPLPRYSGGEGPGGEGANPPDVVPSGLGRMPPHPNPSPPEYRGRGAQGAPRFTLSTALIPLCAFAAGGLLASGMIVKGQEAQAGSFFGGGFFVLVLGLILVWRQLRSGARTSRPRQSLAGLAVRNAGRHAVRSVLTIGLLGSASFLIVAVESFHKDAGAEFLQMKGGSGGFPLFAQSDVPIFEDLNDPAVRKKLTFPNDSGHGSDVTFYPCRFQAGDDASCLNLYQPQMKPRILGVPKSLIKRGGFSFESTLAQTAEEKDNPWLLLTNPQREEGIPAFVDANSAQYILHKELGDTYEVTDERGEPVKLRIVGLFHESVFQSEVVLADASFQRLFPRQTGFSFFLIDGPKDETNQIKTAWESALGNLGLSIETTTSRLDKYLAVENTYLATFQALGGLGLLLGAAGLAIVLLRSVWERRGELALLRALGFRRLALALLVMVENVFLLLAGLLIGLASALLAVAPHLAGGGAHILGLRVLTLLALVVAAGLAAGSAAVFTTLRAPLLPALRQE